MSQCGLTTLIALSEVRILCNEMYDCQRKNCKGWYSGKIFTLTVCKSKANLR